MYSSAKQGSKNNKSNQHQTFSSASTSNATLNRRPSQGTPIAVPSQPARARTKITLDHHDNNDYQVTMAQKDQLTAEMYQSDRHQNKNGVNDIDKYRLMRRKQEETQKTQKAQEVEAARRERIRAAAAAESRRDEEQRNTATVVSKMQPKAKKKQVDIDDDGLVTSPDEDIQILLPPNTKSSPTRSSSNKSKPAAKRKTSSLFIVKPTKVFGHKAAPKSTALSTTERKDELPTEKERSPSPPIENLAEIIKARRTKARKSELALEERKAAERDKTRRIRKKASKKQTSDDELMGSDADDDEDADFEDLVQENERRERDGGTPDLLLQRDEPIDESVILCPFCSRSFPVAPSKRLSALQVYLLARPNIIDAPTRLNPAGKRLPVTDTASFCRLHEEEEVIIPAGKLKRWPSKIDWVALPRRLDRNHAMHLARVIDGTVQSEFAVAARKEWTEKGARKMGNIMSEWGSFDVEDPGYYGPKGFEIITTQLRKLFVEDVQTLSVYSCAPLDIPAFIRRILVPEAAVCLIAEDLKITREEAIIVRSESSAYGKAIHGSTEEEEKFVAEEKAERERKREEKAEKKRQEEERKAERAAHKKKGKDISIMDLNGDEQPVQVFRKPKKAYQSRNGDRTSSPPSAAQQPHQRSSSYVDDHETSFGSMKMPTTISNNTIDISSSDNEVEIHSKPKLTKPIVPTRSFIEIEESPVKPKPKKQIEEKKNQGTGEQRLKKRSSEDRSDHHNHSRNHTPSKKSKKKKLVIPESSGEE